MFDSDQGLFPWGGLRRPLDVQRRLEAELWGKFGPLRVRMAVHAGAAEERDGDDYGPALNRADRRMSARQGGQVLPQTTYELARDTSPKEASLESTGSRA